MSTFECSRNNLSGSSDSTTLLARDALGRMETRTIRRTRTREVAKKMIKQPSRMQGEEVRRGEDRRRRTSTRISMGE